MYSEKERLHIREKKHRQGDLRTIALDVTGKCNMHCRFCYADTFANKEPVSLEVLERATKEAYDMGVFHYILQGGEVLADYDRLKAIIKMIYPDETYINVVSNGWMMTKDVIDELKELGVDRITFSLDSGIEKEHDENRMLGGYRRVLTAIDQVLSAGLLSGISTVVTHQSFHSDGFVKAYKIAEEKGIKFDVQIAEPVGKWDGNRECLITEEDSRKIYDLYRNSPISPNGQRMVKRDIFRGDLTPCCPAGTEFMAITVDGNFMPCNFIQATLGNIKDRSLKEMRDDLLQSDWFNKEYPFCILGESQQYFDEIVLPNKDKEKPLDAYEVFGLRKS